MLSCSVKILHDIFEICAPFISYNKKERKKKKQRCMYVKQRIKNGNEYHKNENSKMLLSQQERHMKQGRKC